MVSHNMWMGSFTSMNCVVSPRQMKVILVVTAQDIVVKIQTLGASCEGILTSEVFLICNEHLVEILAAFLGVQSCNTRWWVCKQLEWCRNCTQLSICFLTNPELSW